MAAGAGAERTQNMFDMVVTLDVSKLSGWLNAAAFCRVERKACGKRGGMRGRATGGARVGRRRRKQRAQGGPPTAEVVLWQGAGAERTLNMPVMVVTLDVSQPEMFALNVAAHGALYMSSAMSVTADTSQDPIAPCVSSAAAASAQNLPSAPARCSLVPNTPGHGPKPLHSEP